MGALRFGFGLTGTATFTFGMFIVPVLAAALRGDLMSAVELVEQPDERVVYYEPPPPPPSGGGSPVPDEVPEETPTDDAAAGEDMLAKKSETGSTSSGSGSSVGSARTVRGMGSGSAGGTGPITMYRPDHTFETVEVTRHPGRTRRCEPETDAIVKTGARQWEIDRAFVDEYDSIGKAQTLVGWVDRHKDDAGKKDGVVVGGIPCGSPLHLAGIRSGDVVHDVNGHEIKGVMSALGAWRKLKRAETIEVNITRDGEPIQVRYTIT